LQLHDDSQTRSPLRGWKRLTPLAGIIALALVAAGVAVAVGAIGDDTTPPPGPDVATTTPVAEHVSAQQQAAFGILRRDFAGSDALPASAGRDLENTAAVKRFGMNVALARRAETDAGAVWVIAGNGNTCLVTNVSPIPAGGTDVSQGGATCASDEQAAAGTLVMSTTLDAAKPPHELIAGLVPDGVDQAVVQLSDGDRQTLVVHDNVYTGEFDGTSADTVTFSTNGGDVVVHP
jgi:hypothetical protein